MNGENVEKLPDCEILRGPDLIKLLPPQTKIFDNVSTSSQSSDLSCPFSDVFYTVEVLSKRKAKELYGKDLYTAFSFSSEFKTAIEQLKKEMLVENPDYLNKVCIADEKFEEIRPKEPEDDETADQLIQFPGIDYEIEPEDEEIDEKKKEKKKKKIWLDDDESFYDTMSGYWRLLSVFDDFKIAPPWYDAYEEGKKHWLQTKPIPIDVFENSKKKCMTWLDKYFDK